MEHFFLDFILQIFASSIHDHNTVFTLYFYFCVTNCYKLSGLKHHLLSLSSVGKKPRQDIADSSSQFFNVEIQVPAILSFCLKPGQKNPPPRLFRLLAHPVPCICKTGPITLLALSHTWLQVLRGCPIFCYEAPSVFKTEDLPHVTSLSCFESLSLVRTLFQLRAHQIH